MNVISEPSRGSFYHPMTNDRIQLVYYHEKAHDYGEHSGKDGPDTEEHHAPERGHDDPIGGSGAPSSRAPDNKSSANTTTR